MKLAVQCFGVLFCAFIPVSVLAEKSPNNISRWYAVTAENDAFGVIDHSDNGYSNGIVYAWGRVGFENFDDIDMPDWIRFISDWTYLNNGQDSDYAISYGIAQGMYTPEEIEDPELDEDDRPYAGTLLWRSELTRINERSSNGLGLTLGVAGPASLAEQSQKIVHKMIGAAEPQGWDHQIENEPVFRIDAEYLYRIFDVNFADVVSVDTVFLTEAGVGNLRSDIGAGLGFRLGNYLDNNFAFYHPITARAVNTFAAAPYKQFHWQFSASAYGNYVFNDIVIDGNTFKDSHSAELTHEQAFVSLSLACAWYNWGLIFSTQRGTDQFEGQPDITNFGALTITYSH